ncbi:MAG: hypothetical protein PHI98_12640 [Eubacteriales bacterium]|nr:hypothetical protein [Eubacteriales bacterium]
MDETIEDGYDGVFIGDAIVQVESIEQGSMDRYWRKVRYLYGDDFADGTLKWTETSTVYCAVKRWGYAPALAFSSTPLPMPNTS